MAHPAPDPTLAAQVGSLAFRQLVIEGLGLNLETMTPAAVRDAPKAHLQTHKHIPVHVLHGGTTSSPAFMQCGDRLPATRPAR